MMSDVDTGTLANMEVALDRVCGKASSGQQHEVRERVAQAIVRCAISGNTTLGALTEAGEKALWASQEAQRSRSL